MLDTIRLYTKDFELTMPNSFETVPRMNCFGEVLSQKTFCNLPSGARLNIKPQKPLGSLLQRIAKPQETEDCLFLEVSLPKLLYGTSLKELQENDLERCIEELERELKAAGAIVQTGAVENMPLSRLDYCRNIKVQHSIVDYLALLRNCSLGKRARANWQTETVLWYNGSQEFTAYNKVLEVQSRHKDTRQLVAPKQDILRLESRMKRAPVIRQELKERRTLAECFNFELAKQKLLSDYDKLVLNVGEQLQLNFLEDLERLQGLREKTRYSWQLFLAEYGTSFFLAKYNYDLELVKKLLLETYQRRQAYNILKSLKLFIAERRTPEERHLLRELRDKLAA